MLYYDQYLKCFAVDSQEENDHFILFAKTEKGRFNVDLLRFMPCTKKQFCMLLDIVSEDLENERRHIATLQEFILECVSILEKIRNGYSDSTQKAKYTSMLNKWNAYYNELAKRYNLEEKADPEKVKYKSCFVYALHEDGVKRLSGFQFEKYGKTFHVYQKSKGYYIVIVPECGLQIASGSTKAAAVVALTPELFQRLNDEIIANSGKFDEFRRRFYDEMRLAGFDYELENAVYMYTPEPEKASQPEEDKTTIDGSNFDEYGAKDPETWKTTPLCYNANDGYIYAVVNGTIYSTCTYKNHKPLYDLEVIPLAVPEPPEPPKDAACKRENALKWRYIAISYTLYAASRNDAKTPHNATNGAIKSSCHIDGNGAIIDYISSLHITSGKGHKRRKTALQYTSPLLHAIRHDGGVIGLYLPRLEVFKTMQGGYNSGVIQRSNMQAAYNNSS